MGKYWTCVGGSKKRDQQIYPRREQSHLFAGARAARESLLVHCAESHPAFLSIIMKVARDGRPRMLFYDGVYLALSLECHRTSSCRPVIESPEWLTCWNIGVGSAEHHLISSRTFSGIQLTSYDASLHLIMCHAVAYSLLINSWRRAWLNAR